MKILLKSITIDGYKSFGKQKRLKINDTITSIIGKNESGKTNLLNLLSNISFRDGIDENEFNQKNRKLEEENNISFELEFSFDDSEKSKYLVDQDITTVTFTDSKTAEISGSISELICENKELQDAIHEILEHFENNIFMLTTDTIESNDALFNSLRAIQERIYFNYSSLYRKIKKWSKKIEDPEIKKEILKSNKIIFDKLKEYYSLFPSFYLHEADELKDTYNCNRAFFDEGVINDQALNLFCSAAGVSMNELKEACLSSDPGKSKDAKDQIQNKIKKEIQDEFNNFYKQEQVSIKVDFNKTNIGILIDTSNSSMRFSERSDGLRWYLMLFISLKAKDILNEKIVMLIDEPGTKLHVNAQRKLLELFESLTKHNKQLIYTTHSPYMLDNDSIVKSRGIEKVDGMSTFINKIYSEDINSDTKLETLSPLLKVIGLDMKYDISPSNNNLNLITEGITDFMYIKAMLNKFKIDNISLASH